MSTPEGRQMKSRVVSLPLEQACSSFLSNSRSLEIYRLCVFVFQPGGGPAEAPSAELFCLGLLTFCSEITDTETGRKINVLCLST